MVKNPPCSAGDVGLITGQETKVPHASEKLSQSPHATTKALPSEALAPQLASPGTATKDAHGAVKILIAKKNNF